MKLHLQLTDPIYNIFLKSPDLTKKQGIHSLKVFLLILPWTVCSDGLFSSTSCLCEDTARPVNANKTEQEGRLQGLN